jgi:hypothetical protein
MSTYGLKTFDASGAVIVDITDRLNRHRYNNEVAADASSNVTLSDIDGTTTALMSIMINPPTENTALSSRWCPHQITRSGTTITWTASTGLYHVSNASLLSVFFYV